jgi:hypothetical protein
MWTPAGEDTTDTVNGVGTPGTSNRFPTEDWNRTGGGGMTIGIGKGGELGGSRTTNLDQSERERNLDSKGNRNIIRGLRSAGMSKKDGSPKEERESIEGERNIEDKDGKSLDSPKSSNP